jgi:ribonuclease Z
MGGSRIMKLQIMGCHAATPRFVTQPSSQVLQAGRHMFLIDCGEGTQMQLRRFRVRFSRIEHIFISHLHGDHFFGLPGLISTFRLLGREKPLHIYGPRGIREAITLLLKLGDSWTNYPLHFHELSASRPEVIFDDGSLSVKTLPLDHRVYTNGFLFELSSGERKLRIEEVRKYGIDRVYYGKIKQGADATDPNGNRIPNALLTDPAPEPKRYAYCSDTAYAPELVPLIAGVDTLYHESTFLESESRLAPKTKHSTAAQAARIALEARVGQLILGHYSTRYKNLDRFRDEASAIFPNVQLAEDGKYFEW